MMGHRPHAEFPLMGQHTRRAAENHRIGHSSSYSIAYCPGVLVLALKPEVTIVSRRAITDVMISRLLYATVEKCFTAPLPPADIFHSHRIFVEKVRYFTSLVYQEGKVSFKAALPSFFSPIFCEIPAARPKTS